MLPNQSAVIVRSLHLEAQFKYGPLWHQMAPSVTSYLLALQGRANSVSEMIRMWYEICDLAYQELKLG